MKKLLLVFLSFTLLNAAMAQKNHWSAHTAGARISTDKAVARVAFPIQFRLFDLNTISFRNELFTVTGKNAAGRSTIISLPNAAGQIEEFEVFEASNFEPDLQARFPDIRAFSGRGITDKYATLKLSISPQGVQTMVFRTEKDNEFIEPYSQDHRVYAVFTSQRTSGKLPWLCTTPDQQLAIGLNGKVAANNTVLRSTGDLKTMRLAQSVTAEYSNFFGATSSAQVGLVLAAINATLARCNGVYEKDLAVHLNLVAASTNVIYYNASTDPYSPASSGAGGAWNGQLQSTLTSVIGEANYDIGHLFGASGGGGNAGCIGCICSNGSKGSGFTSPADAIPQGDNFDIDYVVHEVGHQMGANHTFSFSNEGTGVNKEVGSGITIMGYAGITSQDVAPHSIDIFHQASIAQIQANLGTKACPVTTVISNATPVIATLTNYTIPKSTPFALTGSASDANAGDVLTYCWEQNDNAGSSQTGASSVASVSKSSGPNWISFRPTISSTRYFPQLSTILAGGQVTGPLPGGDAGANIEALSSVARTLNFRLTVRDNAPYSSSAPVSVGQTNFKDVVVTVSAASGPFAVTAPNTGVTYPGGSTQNITWSVASTTAAPVSCANVEISLSTDGGQTFPTVLIASTPNDGTQALVIPATPTTTARIKIEAVGNIFFDISNTNFTIGAAVTCGDPSGLTASAIGNNNATVSWTAVANAVSYAVDYKLNSSGTWTSFSTAQAGTSANLTGLTQGSLYDWRVSATCASGTGNKVVAQFTTTAPVVCGNPTGLTASAITNTSATVSWTAVTNAVSYAVDYKLNTSGTWISFSTAQAGTSANLTGLTQGSLYDWRVSATCAAGSGSKVAAQFTTTAPFVCNAPAGLTASAITTTGATLNWSAVSGAISYVVEYKLSTASTWTVATFGTTATSIAISGLTAGTTYNYRVRTNCGHDVFSPYSTAQFTTNSNGCQSPYDVTSNGSTGGAATIPFNTNITGLISPSADIDYYKFVITTSGTITITLSTLPGDYDIRLYNGAGNQVAISQNGGTSSETINYNAAAGTYYARVYGYNNANSSTVCYTLRVALGTATREGEMAPLFTSKKLLMIYPNPAKDKLNINLTGYEGVSEMKLYDVNGKQISSQRTSQTNSLMDISRLARGVYFIKVITANGEVLNQKIVKQ
ncbi:MAG: reprolysin-like metallopeptidase [Ferruginibacter sp.]